MDKLVTLRINGTAQGLKGAVTAAGVDLDRLKVAGRQAGQALTVGMDASTQKASALGSVLGLVRSQLAGIVAIGGATISLRGLRAMADGYANISNRLKLVTAGEQALAATRERTFGIAQATNTEYASTATLYSRLIKSARDLGQSQQEQAETASTLATAINQSFQVSGTSAANANAAVLQLSQGLAAGVLRGDEFNSVMENSPRLAQALADGLNVGIGKLREMAEAGELTSDVVVRALSGQAAVIGAEFAALDLTIERSWTNLENAVLRYIGRADQANGTSRSIAQGIADIADNIGPIVDALTLVAQAALLAFGGKALQALNAWIARNAQAAAQQAISAGVEREMAQAVLATAQARATELAASAGAIDAARAELVTKQALARVEIESAQATLRATEATQFMSGAMHVRREATERLVVAQARLNAISNEFAALGVSQATLTKNLAGAADDLQAAQARVNATMTTGQMVMAKLSSIGSSLFAMIGGWPTVILATVYASYKLWDSFESGGERMANAVEAANQVIEQNERALDRLQAKARGVDEAMVDNVVSFTSLTDAAAESQKQLDGSNALLERYGATLQSLGGITAAATGAYTALQYSAGQAENAVAAATETQQLLIESSLLIAAAKGEESAALSVAVDAYVRSGATFESVYQTLQKLGLEAQYLNSIWRDAPKAVTGGAAAFSKETNEFIAAMKRRNDTIGLSSAELVLYEANERAALETTQAGKDAILAEAKALAAKVRAHEASTKAVDHDTKAAADFIERLRDEVATHGASEVAKRRVELASLKLTAAQRKEGEALLDTLEALEAVNPETERLAAVYAAAAAAAETLVGGNVDLEEQIAQNADKLAGLSDEQIAYNAALRETNKLIAEAMALGPMTAEQYAAIEARLKNIRTAFDQSVAIKDMEELGRVSEESARRSMDAWDQFTGSLAQAVVDGSQGVKRWWRSLIDDMKRQLLQSGLLQIFGQILNTGGARAGGSLLGTLFSGGAAASTGNGGGLLNGILGSISGGLSGLSAGISSGVTGILGGIFGSAGTTAAINPITGATIYGGGGFAGTLGAIAGPIAIAAGIASLVNTISNGRLFGTSYKPNGSSTQLNFGEIVSGSQSVEEVRQRSLFRGRQWRTTTTALGDDALDPLRELQDRLRSLASSIATQFGVEAAGLVSGSFKQTFDKDGKLVSEISTVLGRTFRESAEEFQQRLTAEQIFAGLSIAMQNSLAKAVSADLGDGGGFGGGGGRGPGAGTGPVAAAQDEVQRIAERWRDDAATLLEGANFLLLAFGAIKGGNGLLGLNGTLTETTDLVERLNRGEETLSDTFARLLASTNLLEEAARLSGAQFDLTRVEFVEFAAAITDAAGGLEQAQALWANFFDTFYGVEERGLQALEAANAARETALSNIGLDSGITNEQFRAAFEAALPTLTPEEIVEWLRAGAAIRAASDAQTAYNEALDQAEQPMRDYQAAVRELAEAALDGSLTDYQREIRAINAARDKEVVRLNELARAAGLQGAAEEDLAAIHVIAARKAAEALAKLRQYGRDLVEQFNGGSQLDLLNEQIAAIESSSSSMYQSQVDGLGAVDDAARSTYEAQVAAQQRIREFLDNLMLGPLGGLRPRDQLAEGQRQFDALLERALGGDAEAMAALPQLADQLLRIGQQVYASGDPYFNLRDTIMAALEQVAALPATAPTGTPGTGGGVEVSASSELQALYDERDRLLAEQTAAERLALAQEISAVIRDLAMATGAPLETIAADLNVNLRDLVSALGVSLEDMTAASAAALGDIAASMGVNLSELAANVGVDLGSLADRQSLLNDALEAQIAELPEGQRDQLEPLLRAVEDAAALGDTQGVEDGVSALEAAVNELAPSLREQLAPYFEGVDPIDYTQLDALTYIDQSTAAAATTLTAHTDILNRIADNLRESNSAAGLPAYATGTTYVPRTGPALIHEGEMILPAPVARFLRQPQGGGGASNAAVEALRAELRALREENAKLLQLVANKLGEVKSSVDIGADKQAKATDRQTLVIGARK